jgi:hypothetical protein
MSKDYRVIAASTGTSGSDAVNKFTEGNPDWTLFNVVASAHTNSAGECLFIFERPKKDKPKTTPPTGGTEAALLTEHTSVIPFRRAA